ncbi:dapper homolog 1 [Pleurodeles waltl]|uniref:dapper homolog 1 n=1 Tax=Pleurodeles waltl TaxID=8319 RepID=UPI0037095E41
MLKSAIPVALERLQPPESQGRMLKPGLLEPRGWREKGEAESERQRTRERLEATLAGLGELEYLRHRQEGLVKAALSPGARSTARPEPRSLEERILEENILLLRKQLNCLRRRDAGLLTQLHELDKQISDLRIDGEKTPNEHNETDSRPSSGFYELSDGTSGSLSNSSNSVFSECLSSCHSSTCFGSPLEASLTIPEGRPKSTDDLLDWIDHKGSQNDDQASSVVRRSLSAPNSSSSDVVADVHPRYQCDLVSKNGSDVYRYPSPLHAVAVQSPMFLVSVMGSLKEERLGCHTSDGCTESETSSVTLETSKNNLCNVPCSSKKLDSYILGVIQKKVHSVRTNKPRTSVNADPSKGILRHGSICLRQTGGVSQSNSANMKNAKPTCLHSGGTNALDVSSSSSPKQWSKELPSEQLESRRMPVSSVYPPSGVNEVSSTNVTRNNVKTLSPVLSPVVTVDVENPAPSSVPTAPVKESPCMYPTSHQENKVIQPPTKIAPKNNCRSPYQVAPSLVERPQLDFKSEGSSSQSFDEGLLVKGQYIPAQEQGVKLHKGTKNVKIVKSSTLKHRTRVVHVIENGSQTLKDKNKVSKKCRFSEDVDVNKKAKRPAPKTKKTPHLQIENGLPSRSLTMTKPLQRPPGHGKEGVLAKPKYKRGDYRRWKTSAEMSYEEALRRARRRPGMEPVGVLSAKVQFPYPSPYAYIASDSEYSAECESLFHSTVVDTSEDEKSNYTTNCFGDSESSLSEVEFVGESTTSSDSEESGGLIWSQFVQTLPMQTATATELQKTAKAFVKIKASHNLKKKILRFRSGSLKLMTTV